MSFKSGCGGFCNHQFRMGPWSCYQQCF